MELLGHLRRLNRAVLKIAADTANPEQPLLLLGSILAEQMKVKQQIHSLSEVEFRVFSQFGDDGIVQWLATHVDFLHRTFIEFGVENYRESTTRFLMMHDNWSGFVMDGSAAHITAIVHSEYFWRHELYAHTAFVDRENINSLLSTCPFDHEVGILHIDLDGNDYWIWNQINVISPSVVILEYNSVFGVDRPVTVPYDRAFRRTHAHYSNLYFGASLRALHQLSTRKGYAFIGCNSAGNNAYFVRRDKLNAVVREVPLQQGFVASKFRDSRNQQGELDYLAGAERLALIKGLPVFNTETEQIEPL